MQRINIQVDLKDNEVLEKEIQDAIASAAKAKAREAFHTEFVKEEIAYIVKMLYPQEIVKLIEQKKIEELKQRIKELELENEKLKRGEGVL